MYPEQRNYLIHWLKKGEKAKYIDKIKMPNGRRRYFYTQAQLDAYKRSGGQLSKPAGSLADKARQGLRGLKEGATSAAARGVVNVTSRNQRLRSLLGGQHQENAVGWNRMANASQQEARAADRTAHEYAAKAASQERRNASGALYRRDAEFNREDATSYASNASTLRSKAADEQKKYDRSIVGRAENRVAADARRAKQQPQQPKPAKQSARKSSGESLGSKASRALGKAKEAATDKAAEALVGAASRSKTVRNAVGGKHEEYSKQWGEMANASQRRAQAADRKAHEDSAAAARQDRKYGSGGDRYRESARINREEAESAASNASTLRFKAADERRQYENSLLGRAQARVNRKGKKKSSSKKKSNRLNLSGGNYAVFQDAKIGR